MKCLVQLNNKDLSGIALLQLFAAVWVCRYCSALGLVDEDLVITK